MLSDTPLIQVRVTPAVVDIVQYPSQVRIEGAQGETGAPLKATLNANPGALPSGERLSKSGEVRITGVPGGVEVNLIQRMDVSFSVTGVRVNYLAS